MNKNMNEHIIYDNVSIQYILDALTKGTIGLEDDVDIDDLLIVYTGDNNLFKNVVIKPTVIDLSQKVLNILDILNTKFDFFETELIEYIVYTVAIDEDGKKILMNVSLTEYLFMFENQEDLLSINNWKLIWVK